MPIFTATLLSFCVLISHITETFSTDQTSRQLDARVTQLLDNSNPVTYMSTPEMIAYYGYPAESHRVTTADGYIITMHRIPHGKNGPGDKKRPALLLQHGVMGSSTEWMFNTRENLLPLRLADAGYDVWFGNSRGNAYSREHVNMTVKERRYWQFSMNEMGKYDLPAEIDHILGLNGHEQLSYIGFSMGTTQFWIMMSYHPEYNAKVKFFLALAPVIYINNMKGAARLTSLLEIFPIAKNFFDFLFNGEFPPPWIVGILKAAGPPPCSNSILARLACTPITWLYFGINPQQVDIKVMPVFFYHVPSPISIRTGFHLIQYILKGEFLNYDFGRAGNMKRYGTPVPPKYYLKNTKVPTAILYGLNDAVVDPIDVERALPELPNVISSSPINHPHWHHFDYHIAKNANTLCHDRILKLLAENAL